ncbi:hypothetical protein FCV25MIE_00012 [Fagus crenata]
MHIQTRKIDEGIRTFRGKAFPSHRLRGSRSTRVRPNKHRATLASTSAPAFRENPQSDNQSLSLCILLL